MTVGKFKPFRKSYVGQRRLQIGLNFRLPQNFPTGQKIGGVSHPHTPRYLRTWVEPPSLQTFLVLHVFFHKKVFYRKVKKVLSRMFLVSVYLKFAQSV